MFLTPTISLQNNKEIIEKNNLIEKIKNKYYLQSFGNQSNNTNIIKKNKKITKEEIIKNIAL